MEKHLPLQTERSHAEYRRVLFSGAFGVIEGTAYNRAAHELREQARGGLFALYEIVLEADQPWEYLKGQVYPSLIRYLRYKSLDPRTAQGLVVSLFSEDQFYLIQGPQFIKAFCEIEGIDENGFGNQVTRWLSAVSL